MEIFRTIVGWNSCVFNKETQTHSVRPRAAMAVIHLEVNYLNTTTKNKQGNN